MPLALAEQRLSLIALCLLTGGQLKDLLTRDASKRSALLEES